MLTSFNWLVLTKWLVLSLLCSSIVILPCLMLICIQNMHFMLFLLVLRFSGYFSNTSVQTALNQVIKYLK